MKISLEQWLELNKSVDGAAIPLSITVDGESMLPFIRPSCDRIILNFPKKLKVGDIVLFCKNSTEDFFCLHRIIRIKGDRVKTFGDGNYLPDLWCKKSDIKAVAVKIERGKKQIDCNSRKWRAIFKCWTILYPIRPLLLFMYRLFRKK